jgi:hypothetical protein
MKLIISTAHEVVQCLPLNAELYKCVRCNLKGPLALLFSTATADRCRQHFESAISGWEHDNRFEMVDVGG